MDHAFISLMIAQGVSGLRSPVHFNITIVESFAAIC